MKQRIKAKLEDIFDVNYSVSCIPISTMKDFNRELVTPFKNKEKIYYRGERILSEKRRLVPTFLRKQDIIKEISDEAVINLTGDILFDYYSGKKRFMSVYNTLYSECNAECMYNMLAFAQHYLDISPLIDFSKNLFVSLSFALKGRENITEDIVIYTVYDIGNDDTSTDIKEVNGWLKNYNVHIVDTKGYFEKRREEKKPAPERHSPEDFFKKMKALEDTVNSMYPTAKLIDIPTNDLMKYQQGVFLLLNGFSIIDGKYFTKSVRNSFILKKYIISYELCGELTRLLEAEAPQYVYKNLMDISCAVRDF